MTAFIVILLYASLAVRSRLLSHLNTTDLRTLEQPVTTAFMKMKIVTTFTLLTLLASVNPPFAFNPQLRREN